MKKNEHTGFGPTDYLGIWVGKMLISAARLAGREGGTLPGRISLRLAPGVLAGLSKQPTKGNLVITGTNGKTTTTALLVHILQTAGYSTVSNNTGSNLSWGIATSLINASTWSGNLKRRYGVLEVDEGFFPLLAGQLQPVGAVVTNVFPDQLDRFGEMEYVRQSINRGLAAMPARSFRVLNADDPFLASLEDRRDATWYFGLEAPSVPETDTSGASNPGYICPRCRQFLDYRQIFLAHLGHYRCWDCGFERPRPQVSLLGNRQNEKGEMIMKLDLQGEQMDIRNPLPGICNVYNVLAGVTAALALGLPVSTLKKALSGFSPSGGRQKRITLGETKKILVITLIKNAVGADQALAQLPCGQEKFSLLMAINDRPADGIDVSWLWNARFEQLAGCQERFHTLTVSGTRAWEMALRLKYAGLDEQQIAVEKNPGKALRMVLLGTPPGNTIYIWSNYTALAELGRALKGLKPRYRGGLKKC